MFNELFLAAIGPIITRILILIAVIFGFYTFYNIAMEDVNQNKENIKNIHFICKTDNGEEYLVDNYTLKDNLIISLTDNQVFDKKDCRLK